MIESIRVLNEVYNFDPKRPSSDYLEQDKDYGIIIEVENSLAIAAANAAESIGERLPFTSKSLVNPIDNQDFGFRLKNKSLTKDHVLDLKDGSLYIVVGRNGIGKTTFLNSIYASLMNYKIYDSSKRSALYCGNFGLSSNGLPSQSINGAIPKTNLIYLLNINQTPFNEKNINKYVLEAFKFYLSQDELYNNNFFDVVNRLSEKEVDNRFIASISNEILNFEETTFLNRAHIERALINSLESVVKNLESKVPEVKKRLIYLIQHRDSIPELPVPSNIYGQYEITLKSGNKIQDLRLLKFDPRKRTLDHDSSMGEYARRELELMLTEKDNSGIYLLDEPTGNADRVNNKWIKDEFLKAMIEAKCEKTLIFSSNDESFIEKAASYGARFIDLDKEPARIVSFNELS